MLNCKVCNSEVQDSDLVVVEHKKEGNIVCKECEEIVRANPEQYLVE